MIDPEARYAITPKGIAYLRYLNTASNPNSAAFNAGYESGFKDGLASLPQYRFVQTSPGVYPEDFVPYSDCDAGCPCTMETVHE